MSDGRRFEPQPHPASTVPVGQDWGYCVCCGQYTTGEFVDVLNNWSDSVRGHLPAPADRQTLLLTEEPPAGHPESVGKPGDHVNVGRVDTVLNPADRPVVDAYKLGELELGQVSIPPDLPDSRADLPSLSLDPER